MSEPAADAAAATPAVPAVGPMPCPRCGAEIAADQSWCLECGLAARTRLAPTPNWRVPLGVAAAVGVAAIAALVIAFLILTGDNAPVPPATSTAAPAAVAPPAATTVPAAPPPATTPATTPAPPAATTTIPPAAVPPATPTTTAPVAPTGAG